MTLKPGDVRVFISYSHEDESHNLGVQAMAAKLEELGFSVFLDARQEIPPTSWSELIERELPRADVVLCVCTPTYVDRVDGVVPGGQGRGVAQEAALVRAEAYDQKMRADRFRVVHLQGTELAIPRVLGGSGAHYFGWPSDRDSLVKTLRAPTKRRRITDALGEVFDDDVDALKDWAKSFVPLGRDTVLDFDDRARRVANGLLTHREPLTTKQALQALVAERRGLTESLDEVARELGVGRLTGTAKRARVSSTPAPGSLTAELETAYSQREELTIAGEDTTEVEEKILELRRRQRRGPALHPGEFLGDGRFRLVDVVGSGGFATVWSAYDRHEQTLVAIKVLHGQFAQDPSRRERLFRGARKMAQLRHPNVVQVLVSHAEDQGFFYYVMEYVPGRDLYRAVVEKRVDTERALSMLESIADALGAAHAKGLVHRDVKPQNILLREDGAPALSDFDLVSAKDTTGGTRTGAMGTVLYAAPEQHEDASSVDHRADIYSLGMTAAFCVYGRRLPKTAMFDRNAFLSMLPCSEALREVLRKAVAIDPADRHQGVGELGTDLVAARRPSVAERVTEGDRLSAAVQPASEDVSEPLPSDDLDDIPTWNDGVSRRALVFGGAAVGVSAIGGLVWAFVGAGEDAPVDDGGSEHASVGDSLDRVDASTLGTSETSRPATTHTGDSEADSGDAPTEATVITAPRGGVELLRIPAGRFLMGSPENEKGRFDDEGPQHEVELAALYLARTPVTNAQYRVYMEANPEVKDPKYWGNSKYNQDEQPVVGISWHEAQAYCEWAGLRLPTEAQWEYACRAGTTTRYSSGDDETDLARVGWYDGNSGGRLHPVGELEPNDFGLYDMHGNVWEWCKDTWVGNYRAAEHRAGDGLRVKPEGDAHRVIRGGYFRYSARSVRSAYRGRFLPGDRWYGFGFRPAQGID